MKHVIHTGLDRPTTKKVLVKAMAKYMEQFQNTSPRFEWSTEDLAEFGFKAKGISIGGTVRVVDTGVEVDMDVPFLFRPFQSRAMNVIEDQVGKWVTKAKNGELDD